MTTLYKKVGRRYKPVAEHEECDSYPAGAHALADAVVDLIVGAKR